jgi:RimJ/RimL family protein N-acetyltransferase
VRVTLTNGAQADIRPIRPDDKDALVAFVAALSWDSRYRRFLAPKAELTPGEVARLTEVDFHDHVAVVATRAGDPDALIGVGRWVRSAEDPAAAEFAFVVADDMQGKGLGTALVSELADAARARGIRRVIATILPHNIAAHRLLKRISHRLVTTARDGVFEVSGELAA